MFVEGFGGLIDGIYQYATDSEQIGRLKDALYRIFQQTLTESRSVKTLVDREAAKQSDWNWIRHIPANFTCRLCVIDGPCSQRVIRDNNRTCFDDGIGPRGSAFLIAQSVTLEPEIEGRVARIKRRQVVISCQKQGC